MANETETPITDIDSAVSSIIEPVEETTEEVIEESQETEEISAEAEVADEVEEEVTEEAEEIEASDYEDDEDPIDDASLEDPVEPERYTVKVNGQESEVTLEDLKQGYSGQKYVQQGMQEVAAAKKEAEAVYAALTNERQQMADLYQQLQNGQFAPEPVKPTKEDFDADPIGYMQKNLEYEEQKANHDRQMAQLAQATQQNSVAQQNAKQA